MEWNEINFPKYPKDFKKFEGNNKTIALNVPFSQNNKEEIEQAYFLKNNSEHENKVILIITSGEKVALSCCEKLV